MWKISEIIWGANFYFKSFFYDYKQTKFFTKILSPPSGSCMQLCCESVQLRCLPCVAKQVRLDLWLFSHVDKSNGCGKKGAVLRSKIKDLANKRKKKIVLSLKKWYVKVFVLAKLIYITPIVWKKKVLLLLILILWNLFLWTDWTRQEDYSIPNKIVHSMMFLCFFKSS